MKRKAIPSLAVLAIVATLAACSSDSSSSTTATPTTATPTTGAPTTGAPTTASASTAGSTTGASTAGSAVPGSAATESVSLKGICPDNIVVQTDWYATPERAAAYQLVGPNGTFDKNKGTYSGPLGDTGVTMEVRMGGDFINFQAIPAQMYQDPSIFMGLVATDDAVSGYDKFPTVAVMAPLDINPQILMWDPATYPNISTFADVAASKAKVMYIEGLPFMDYLVSKGYVTKDQLDASYDGTPARFISEGGKLIQQAYLSSEPYRWEHDVPEWNKPVKSLLIDDSGYRIYPQGLAVKPDEITKHKDCLAKLVPMFQQAQVDYMNDPAPMNAALANVSTELGSGPPITVDGNVNAVKVMRDSKIVGDGPNGTLGDFDMTRIDTTIDQLRPILAARGQDLPADLTSASIATNMFIDPSISL